MQTGKVPTFDQHFVFNVITVRRSKFHHGGFAKDDATCEELANARDKYGDTVLMLACYFDRAEVAEVLLQRKAQVELGNEDGRTALIWAAERSSLHSARVLMQYKANVNTKDKYKANVNTKDKYKANVNTKDKEGGTALTYAAVRGHDAMSRFLLQQRADVHNADSDGDTALICAGRYGRNTVLKTLLQHKSNPDTTNKCGRTAMILACMNGQLEATRTLLAAKANREVRDVYGHSAWDYAAAKRFTDLMELLVPGSVPADLSRSPTKTPNKRGSLQQFFTYAENYFLETGKEDDDRSAPAEPKNPPITPKYSISLQPTTPSKVIEREKEKYSAAAAQTPSKKYSAAAEQAKQNNHNELDQPEQKAQSTASPSTPKELCDAERNPQSTATLKSPGELCEAEFQTQSTAVAAETSRPIPTSNDQEQSPVAAQTSAAAGAAADGGCPAASSAAGAKAGAAASSAAAAAQDAAAAAVDDAGSPASSAADDASPAAANAATPTSGARYSPDSSTSSSSPLSTSSARTSFSSSSFSTLSTRSSTPRIETGEEWKKADVLERVAASFASLSKYFIQRESRKSQGGSAGDVLHKRSLSEPNISSESRRQNDSAQESPVQPDQEECGPAQRAWHFSPRAAAAHGQMIRTRPQPIHARTILHYRPES
eukprot:g12784.t1